MESGSMSNALLGALTRQEQGLVVNEADFVTLRAGDVLCEPGRSLEYVYFIERGFLSVIATGNGRDQVEVAQIGREGMFGVVVALGGRASAFRALVQVDGAAWRLPAQTFKRLTETIPALLQLSLTYAQLITVQIAETGRANARQTVESRLARWLLMAHDRLDSDDLAITHETLSLMLGVRRPGVTVALHILEGERMIKSRRGSITILNREKLDAAAKGSYGKWEAEHQRTLRNLREDVRVAAA